MGSLTCDWCGCEHSDDADYSCCDCGRELDTMYPTTPQNPEWCKGCGYAPGNCHCAKPAPAQLSPEMLGEDGRFGLKIALAVIHEQIVTGESQFTRDALIKAVAALDRLLAD